MSTTLEPRSDRLIVEPIEEEKVTKSGLILPDQAREKPQRGRITALGPVLRQELLAGEHPAGMDRPLDIGDEVLYSKYGGTELKIDGKEVILLRETDVFCRVQETDDGEESEIVTKAGAGQP